MKPILVILSSSKHLIVHPDAARKRQHRHPTGFFLSELAVPAMVMKKAGYELVYASPTGNPEDTQVDPISVGPGWFPGGEFEQAKAYLSPPISLAIKDARIGDYAGIFAPGGHAPMEDLPTCQELGSLLIAAECNRVPIGMICHGSAALLSAGTFFSGRQATCFSYREEVQEEPGADNVLGGYVPFYLDITLEERGLEINTRSPWRPHIIVDGLLVTGQNPMSDHRFAARFVEMIDRCRRNN